MTRNLTLEEQRLLALTIGASSVRVDSPDLGVLDLSKAGPFVLAPVNVNIVIDPEMVRRGVESAQRYWLDHPSPNARSTEDLVLSILKAAMDIGRGHSQDGKS